MVTINLHKEDNKNTTLVSIHKGADFKILENTTLPTWLGTKIDNNTVILYTGNGLEVCTLPVATKVTPLALKLVITEE